MVKPITPTRNQIAKMAQDDPELTKALEQLFTVAGAAPLPADIAALTILIENNAYDAGVANNKAESYQPNFQKLDYVDFNRVGPHVPAARRMQWNEDDGTIDVGMNADVVLQIGQETYIYGKTHLASQFLTALLLCSLALLAHLESLRFQKLWLTGRLLHFT